MESKAFVKSISTDFITNKIQLLIEIETNDNGFLEKLRPDMALRMILKKWSEKRSLSANAYFHVLVGKIADELKESKPFVKNVLIGRYGQQEMFNDEPVIFKTNLPESVMMEREDLHCVPCKHGEDATFYKVYRGSHTYSKEEMKILIDGTVTEAKGLGIDTMTPDEIKKMIGVWVYENDFAEK